MAWVDARCPRPRSVIVIAAVRGAVGRALAGGSPGGLITAIALGFIGALVGPWMASQLGLAEPFVLRRNQ